MNINPIIRQIVNRQHVGTSNRRVIRAVVNGLRRKARTFLAMPKADRRALMEQAIEAHRQNRAEYRWVMGGH
jgi:hypothetical protein